MRSATQSSDAAARVSARGGIDSKYFLESSSFLPRTQPIDRCPVCTSCEFRVHVTIPDYLHGVRGTYSYVRCCSCGSVFQNPQVIPDDLGLVYPSQYFTHDRPPHAAPNLNFRQTRNHLRRAILHAADGVSGNGISLPLKIAGWFLSLVPSIRRRARMGLMDALATPRGRTGRCLEVGPGQGQMLRTLASLGWDAVGLEFDPKAAEVCQEVSGCTTHVGTLTSSDLPADSFDMIYMSHVLEHLPDLRPSMQRAWQLLNTSGRMVLIYPNPDSLVARWYPRFSCNWDAPRHLVIPSTGAVRALLSEIGFKKVVVRTSPRRAAHFRQVALRYRGDRSLDKITFGDRAFAAVERLSTAAGARTGEEIIVVAYK